MVWAKSRIGRHLRPWPLSGWWSRRIDDVNRIVYREKDGAIIIASCKGHYEDQ